MESFCAQCWIVDMEPMVRGELLLVEFHTEPIRTVEKPSEQL